MIVKPALAAMLASGLILPEKPGLILPKPAIVRAGSSGDPAPMLPGMPLTMGLLKPAAPSYRTIEYVGSTSTSNAVASGNKNLPLNTLSGGTRSAVQAGDLVLACYAVGSTTDRSLTITDGTSPYTLAGTELYANDTFDTNLRVAYKRMGATPDANLVMGPSGSTADSGLCIVSVFANVDPETPLDVAPVTATGINSMLPNPAAITPVTPGAWIVVCAGAAHNASVITAYTTQGLTTARSSTAGGGTGTNRMANGIGYKSDWVSGTYDPPAWTIAITDSTSFSWAAVTLALRPAPL